MTNPTFKSALVFSPADLPDWADPDSFTERDEEEERGCLLVFEDGKLCEHWDRGEPEDNTFGRDWSWVDSTIDRAYQAGVADGRAQALAELRDKLESQLPAVAWRSLDARRRARS